jgi:HEAT repeat protein
MAVLHVLLLVLQLSAGQQDRLPQNKFDLPRLREMLRDAQHPRQQSQAALLLIQNPNPEAAEIIQTILRQVDSPEAFCAIASAIRISRDTRFLKEIFVALHSAQPLVRAASAECLTELADDALMARLQTLLDNPKVELEVRQTIARALARSTKKSAVDTLVGQLANPDTIMRQTAADALATLTGMSYGLDVDRWNAWWREHHNLSSEEWLAYRLTYQVCRSQRLEAELERARKMIVHLHEQLYARLSPGDRFNHIQVMAESEEAAVRALAVNWSADLLVSAEGPGQRVVVETLLRLSHDGDREVKRAAILALGRVRSPRAFDRLCQVMEHASPGLRAAAARALGQAARLSGPEAEARQRQVIPILQKALDDPALEVVIEAAESLGGLGVPEAGPVLTVLLHHTSEPVRQTAALALERVADISMLDGLFAALDDPAVAVRFSILGALERAGGDGRGLSESQLARLTSRVEALFVKDADPGVRSRAATVLGNCGSAAVLPVLWGRVLASEENRVQEKAWAAMIDVLSRSGSLELIGEWDRMLADTVQKARRLQLWSEVYVRWQKLPGRKGDLKAVLENLIQIEVDQGKWSAALPLLRELLAYQAADGDLSKRGTWLILVGQQAWKDGNRTETIRILEEARPLLPKVSPTMAKEFERLEKQTKSSKL